MHSCLTESGRSRIGAVRCREIAANKATTLDLLRRRGVCSGFLLRDVDEATKSSCPTIEVLELRAGEKMMRLKQVKRDRGEDCRTVKALQW
jgi:hypothetical protein